ncbi:MAG TPA: hypothetical protein DEQ40_11940 [Oxalobacteraceae bacterium]|nr:hypothetical protein [Oxalobacteraceae bacterium]
MVVSVVDGAGTTITTLSGGQVGTVRAKFTDATGAVLPNAVVKFTASDTSLIIFTPSSGSALTDATGVAVINVKPTDFTSAGALTISAQAVLDSKTGTGSSNISIGAAPLVVGTLSLTPVPTSALAAFNTVTVNIPVTSSGQPVNTAPGLTLTSLCVGDGKATLVPGTVSNGVAVATYTNTGCTRGTDTIAASIGNSSQTISLGVSIANIGAINFISSSSGSTSLVLKGSGGLGRSESALLTFKVVDAAGLGVAGVTVSFTATTTTGGLKVLPASAVTDSTGIVTTSVQSGTIPTSVIVAAQATRNGITIGSLSGALTISTGLPTQKAMSISADSYNIEGMNYDGVQANITIRMADQYGNPISDGTAVNFVSEGGAVGSSSQGACQTLNGGCTVPITSQAFRPLNGRVTILAYAQGIEDFTDSNGDGVYSCTNFTSGDSTSPTAFRPLIDTCVSGGEPYVDLPDAFLNTGNAATLHNTSADASIPLDYSYAKDLGTDGVLGNPANPSLGLPLHDTYDPSRGDLPFPYNHSTYTATGDGHWGINYIRRSVEIVFSGSAAKLQRVDPITDVDLSPNSTVIQGLAAVTPPGTPGTDCAAQTLRFRLTDSNNNPLPFGSTIAASDAVNISAGTFYPATVLATPNVGGTYHTVTIKPEATCKSGSLNIVVTTPKGIGTVFGFSSN